MCKHIFEGNIYFRSKFSCVRAHAHSLEGTLPTVWFYVAR